MSFNVSIGDLALIGLGGAAVMWYPKVTPGVVVEDQKKVMEKKLEFTHASTVDLHVVRNMEYILRKRGVRLPPIPDNDLNEYYANLLVLMDKTAMATPVFEPKTDIDSMTVTQAFPIKAAQAVTTRAGCMAGLSIPLEDIGPEENWGV